MMHDAAAILGMLIGTAIVVTGVGCIITSVKAHWDDVCCPHCEYNLRGLSISAVRCPECGGSIEHRTPYRLTRRPWRAVAGVGLMAAGMFVFAALFVFRML